MKLSIDPEHAQQQNQMAGVSSVEYKPSSGMSKAALATAIPAAALAGLDWIKNNYMGRHDGGYITAKEMELIRENVRQSDTIVRLETEKYTDHAISSAVEKLEGKLSHKVEKLDNKMDFINAKVEKSYEVLSEKYGNLKGAFDVEATKRLGSDERIREYVDGRFMRADKHINASSVMWRSAEGAGCCD